MTATPPPNVAQLINRASRILAREGDAALKPLGLRYAQVPVLALLNQRHELTQKALADAAGIEQPSMAQLLTRMERDGLIERRPHPRDARSQTIALTATTAATATEAHRHLRDLEQRALAGFTAAETDTLKQLLARAVGNLERRHDHDAVAE